MSEFNNFRLLGRLAEDVELYLDVNKKQFASWNLIVNEPFKDQKGNPVSLYLSGVWYPRDVDIIKAYTKGSPVLIKGHVSIKNEKYSDGGNKYTPVLCADSILFLPQKKNEKK